MFGNYFSNLHKLVGGFIGKTARYDGNILLINFIKSSARFNGMDLCIESENWRICKCQYRNFSFFRLRLMYIFNGKISEKINENEKEKLII